MHEISLSAIGADRPGIVAALTGVLADLGCSIEDSDMAVLRGHFAVMLVVSVPDGFSARRIEEALAGVASSFDLVVSARALDENAGSAGPGPGGATWSISVHGADRPGIVHGVTSVLADTGANITALRTHVAGEPEVPLYAMVLEVTVPSGTDEYALHGALDRSAERLGVVVTVTPVEEELL